MNECLLVIGDQIQIVQECEEVIVWMESLARCAQRVVLYQHIQSRHQGIALLAPFSLDDVMRDTFVVCPEEVGLPQTGYRGV